MDLAISIGIGIFIVFIIMFIDSMIDEFIYEWERKQNTMPNSKERQMKKEPVLTPPTQKEVKVPISQLIKKLEDRIALQNEILSIAFQALSYVEETPVVQKLKGPEFVAPQKVAEEALALMSSLAREGSDGKTN